MNPLMSEALAADRVRELRTAAEKARFSRIARRSASRKIALAEVTPLRRPQPVVIAEPADAA